jgi:hypothetical protein
MEGIMEINRQLIIGLAILIAILSVSLYARLDQPVYISPQEAAKMGQQIWQNESGRRVEGLTSWNKGEDFASLGIGHFIWYPTQATGPFRQTFPDFLTFLQENGIVLPKWLEESVECPWKSYEEFKQSLQDSRMIELRQLLAETVDLQIIFMINRLQRALPSILQTLTEDKKEEVAMQFYRLTRTTAGLYSLLDYINFKGEGLSCRECYEGKGWGLRQVLEAMSGNTGDPVREFVDSAKQVLIQRVEHSPPERNEQRWLKGWCNRVESYLSFSI